MPSKTHAGYGTLRDTHFQTFSCFQPFSWKQARLKQRLKRRQEHIHFITIIIIMIIIVIIIVIIIINIIQ